MKHITDLHLHSRFSMATSRDCSPEYLDLWARKKGITILGTGDFTHPGWRQELTEKLAPAGNGLYRLRDEYVLEEARRLGGETPYFVIAGEISSIYKKHGKGRKVHNVILLPGLLEAEQLAGRLEQIGNLHSDGRPILGLDCENLLEMTLDVSDRSMFIPAHIWTPHFGLFGAKSGFDAIEDCFGALAGEIHALETGLSSDPPMNRRWSALDRFRLVSSSDAHSPAKLGREATLLDTETSYEGLYNAIQKGEGLLGTIEFFPEEGKYHSDGHRKCGVCLTAEEARAANGRCPVCGKPLTMGVNHRIEDLADRTLAEGRRRADTFESLVPLPEILSAALGYSAASKRVQGEYERLLEKLGPEFHILREVPVEEIERAAPYGLGACIGRLRAGEVACRPGYDGEYGKIFLLETPE